MLQNIRDMVDAVAQQAEGGDTEAAHSKEKDCWRLALTAIAEGDEDAQALAQAALETTTITFARNMS